MPILPSGIDRDKAALATGRFANLRTQFRQREPKQTAKREECVTQAYSGTA